MRRIERTPTAKAIITRGIFLIGLLWILPLGSHTALDPSCEATRAVSIIPVLFSEEQVVNQNPQKEKMEIKDLNRQSLDQNKSLDAPKTVLIKEGNKNMLKADSTSTTLPISKLKKLVRFELIVM